MDLLNILCTMGLPTINESLEGLLAAMSQFPDKLLGSTLGMAQIVGCCIAIGVGSYECWMMMLGRRGMDVMKILRIIIISICISCSSIICDGLQAPGNQLESAAKASAFAQNNEVDLKQKMVADLQKKYLEKLRAVQDSIAQAQKIEEIGEDASWYEEVMYSVSTLGQTISNYAQRAAVAAETKISEWINDAIRFIGQLIFQMTYYGLLVGQKCFMAILQAFCPLAFALSLAPPFKAAWSQWMSKFLSLSLWGFIVYVCMYYIDFILLYTLDLDITAYQTLLTSVNATWGEIGTLGLQGLGSNCMFVMGMMAGAYLLKFVPEVASWLIPGGVSSGLGGAAGGAVMGIAASANSSTRNAVSQVGTAGAAIAHPGAAAGKAVSSVAGTMAGRAAKNLSSPDPSKS